VTIQHCLLADFEPVEELQLIGRQGVDWQLFRFFTADKALAAYVVTGCTATAHCGRRRRIGSRGLEEVVTALLVAKAALGAEVDFESEMPAPGEDVDLEQRGFTKSSESLVIDDEPRPAWIERDDGSVTIVCHPRA
jgi:hypothetical protein